MMIILIMIMVMIMMMVIMIRITIFGSRRVLPLRPSPYIIDHSNWFATSLVGNQPGAYREPTGSLPVTSTV
jgi:hypothetical protein